MIKLQLATLIIFLTFIGCQRENLNDFNQSPEKEITVEQAKLFYNNLQTDKGQLFNSGIQKKIGIPDWTSAIWQRGEKNSPVILTVNLNYDMGGYGLRKLIFSKIDGEIKGMILQYIGELSYLQKSKGQIRVNDFSGDIHFLNLSGRFIGGCRLRDAKITAWLKNTEEMTSNLSARDNCETSAEGSYQTLCTVTITNNPTGSGWTYISMGMLFYYFGNTYTQNGNGGYCQWCTTTPPYTGGGGCTNCNPPPQAPTVAPYKVIDSLTNTCLINTLTSLKTLGTDSSFFKSIYNNFDSSSKLELTFDNNNQNTGVYGQTVSSELTSAGVRKIKISFNLQNMTTSSKEWMARVFIHEMAHAAMHSGILAWDTANTQHKMMITLYLERMAQSLKILYPALTDLQAYSMEYASFYNNASTYDDKVAEVVRNEINKKFSVNYMTNLELADLGATFDHLGTAGTRVNCN